VTGPRWLALAVFLAAMIFAFQGGEYSTLEWLNLRGQERQEQARVAELQRIVDSLARRARLVETDIETQEQLARALGMLRKGEHAYILQEAPDAKP